MSKERVDFGGIPPDIAIFSARQMAGLNLMHALEEVIEQMMDGSVDSLDFSQLREPLLAAAEAAAAIVAMKRQAAKDEGR